MWKSIYMQNSCTPNLFRGHLGLRKHNGRASVLLYNTLVRRQRRIRNENNGKKLQSGPLSFSLIIKVFNYADIIKTAVNCTAKAIEE